ncbi:MAG: DUF5519 family protein [Anaerolineae bacterium]|nr:DUF5519 family protein [Anaerolineae bacterium]
MLADLVAQLIEEVSSWENISAAPHRFGGTEFSLGRVEIGHIHRNNGMVDIPFTVAIREVLVSEGLAQPHHLLTDSGWITYFVRDDASLQHALWLMRLSYWQKRSRRQAIDIAQVDSLRLSSALQSAVFPRLA